MTSGAAPPRAAAALHVGVTPWNLKVRSAAALSAQAVQAEAWGYRSFWLPESHFNADAIPDPLLLLAAVAAATSRIRLATTSYLLPLRHALLAAAQVAVLDQLSGGRVILGIGRGFAPLMLKAFGVAPAEKRNLFEASLGAMIRAWSGEPVLLEAAGGEQIRLDPLPVQRPHPPLWVAAFGPKALAQAGRLGLPYLASPVETCAALAENYRLHAAAAREAGQSVPVEVPVMRTVFVTAGEAEARVLRERIHHHALAGGRLGADARAEDWCIVGDRGYVREQVRRCQETLTMTHLIVTRLRIDGIDPAAAERSMAVAAELLAG